MNDVEQQRGLNHYYLLKDRSLKSEVHRVLFASEVINRQPDM